MTVIRFFVLFILSLIASFESHAAIEETLPIQIELIQEKAAEPGLPFQIALCLRLKEGWHVYGNNPGEAGLPLKVKWELPAGFEVGPLEWPIPESFVVSDLVGYGYKNKAILLAQITPPSDLPLDNPLNLKATIKWLVCSAEACQPGSTSLDIPLLVSNSSSLPNKSVLNLFTKARAKIPLSPVEASGEIALLDQANLYETRSNPISEQPHEFAFSGGIGMALLFAFIGGMILNLMPCVLPVMSIKVMSFMKLAGENRTLMLRHGWMFAIGVLVSFWILAAVMLVFRSYGTSVGWGFQMQNPLFIVVLASLLFIFALNLFGVFEIGTTMSSWAGQTQLKHSQNPSGYTSSFLSGVLATAIATPCTGPFLGSAIGFAVTLPTWKALLIFTSLAMGMSSPYLILVTFPIGLQFIPKPGPWMETFKQLMGFFLLGTVVWLLWIFNAQMSPNALIFLLIGFLFFSVGAWIYGKYAYALISRQKLTFVYATVCILIVLGCRSITFSFEDRDEPNIIAEASHADPDWHPFSPELLAQFRDEGRPVLIDFTAKWCLVCQTNHIVLTTNGIKKHLKEKGVVKMVADWTKNDPIITEALSQFGRNSVPLYVLYGADTNEQPTILPQILTEGVVLQHLNALIPSNKETLNREEIS